ncbi:hypothetical protein RvY_16422 [Ramazzottius varieornatus]|uniref:Uncharacterized protein n=1 Tax=Ramazzottius varieornatus TaxID=947166 RepID=A0A1D1W164_RAMVA|nr:hypothetical protein RvY_16422 [Ramazzottius varieornatus]
MTQFSWKNGKKLVWDVTVVDALALTTVDFAMSLQAGSVAVAVARRKIMKYHDIGSEFLFCPVGLETAGPWGLCTTEPFDAVGRKRSYGRAKVFLDFKAESINRYPA